LATDLEGTAIDHPRSKGFGKFNASLRQIRSSPGFKAPNILPKKAGTEMALPFFIQLQQFFEFLGLRVGL
jgi:hypothetical protein